MNRLLLAVAIVLSLCCLRCGPSARFVQAATADSIAEGANAALPILIDRYRAVGLEAVARATNEADARADMAEIDRRWEPIWKAWNTLAVAQDSWATALEEGLDGSAALQGLRVAYCGLKEVWPKELRGIPLVPVKCSLPEQDPALVPVQGDQP